MKTKHVPFISRLQIRLIVPIIITVSIFTSIFILFGMKTTRTALEDQSHVYGTSLAEGIAKSCSHAIEKGDNIQLSSIIKSIGESYTQIVGIDVRVADILVARYSTIDDTGAPVNKVLPKGDEFISPVTVSVEGETVALGEVRVILSGNQFYDLFVQQIHTSLFAGIILLIEITVILYLWLNQLIVTPIRRFEEGTEIIGNGNLEHTIDLNRNDEIGHLAEAFNVMTTKVRESQEEIRRWNETLEKKVHERTIELEEANKQIQETQYQLVQSGKMAAIGMIGAGVAHELNNPLGGILGYAQLMISKLKKKECGVEELQAYEKYCGYIEKETQRCKGIVDNLLSFSRKSKTVFEDVNVNEVIEATVSIMAHQLRKWRIETHINYASEPIIVSGNADKLEQVFINFIANSHHAMPEGGKITITVNQVKRKGIEYADLLFADTGCGIAKENLDKLFESFFSTKKEMTNLGLGLNISHQIVTEHKGTITVESELGKGATFIVSLPLKGQDVPVPQ